MRAVLGQVADVQPDPPPLSSVSHGEVVPGEVTSCVGVYPEEEVVLVGCDLNGAVQIAAFEPGLEDEFLLGVEGGVHALKGAVVELVPVELVMRHAVLLYGEEYVDGVAHAGRLRLYEGVTVLLLAGVALVEEDGIFPAGPEVADALGVGGVELGELLRDDLDGRAVELQGDLGSGQLEGLILEPAQLLHFKHKIIPKRQLWTQ